MGMLMWKYINLILQIFHRRPEGDRLTSVGSRIDEGDYDQKEKVEREGESSTQVEEVIDAICISRGAGGSQT